MGKLFPMNSALFLFAASLPTAFGAPVEKSSFGLVELLAKCATNSNPAARYDINTIFTADVLLLGGIDLEDTDLVTIANTVLPLNRNVHTLHLDRNPRLTGNGFASAASTSLVNLDFGETGMNDEGLLEVASALPQLINVDNLAFDWNP